MFTATTDGPTLARIAATSRSLPLSSALTVRVLGTVAPDAAVFDEPADSRPAIQPPAAPATSDATTVMPTTAALRPVRDGPVAAAGEVGGPEEGPPGGMIGGIGDAPAAAPPGGRYGGGAAGGKLACCGGGETGVAYGGEAGGGPEG